MIEINNTKKIICKADTNGRCSFDCKECIYDDIENFRMLYNKNTKRYELKSGKFGYYFYDNQVKVDLTLEMILNKLNMYEIRVQLNYHKTKALRRKIYSKGF